MTAAEDTNAAEQTPDQPCAVCGAEHDEESGTVVGRIDHESDIPLALPDPTEVQGDPFDLSFCNDCIEQYLREIQAHVKIMNPRQTEAAAYMLLGLTVHETFEMVNAREEDGQLAKGTVRDYRSRARRSVREAMQVGLGLSPILKESKQN